MKHTESLFIRLFLAVLLGIPQIFQIFYIIFSPLTITVSYAVIKLFHTNAILMFSESIIRIDCYNLEFVGACTAASAFYLLFLLVVLTKDISLKTRIYTWLAGAGLIFAMNIIRVTILILILLNSGVNWFDAVHLTFWKFVSTIYVVLVWLYLIKKFKIKNIPVYSDFKELYSNIKRKKVKRKK